MLQGRRGHQQRAERQVCADGRCGAQLSSDGWYSHGARQNFDTSVREDSPKVAIINETAAKSLWPGQDAIGKRFKFFRDTEWTQVIGIAHDSKYNTLGEDPVPYMYVSLIQNPSTGVSLLFRTAGDPNKLLSSVRSQVQSLDRNLPLTFVWPIGEVISQALWTSKFGASLLTIFALVAMALCAVGIYGVVAYSVGQRLREFGIRLALGAQPKDVMMMVVRQSAITLSVGLAAGLISAFALARLIVTILYGVSASEPLAFWLRLGAGCRRLAGQLHSGSPRVQGGSARGFEVRIELLASTAHKQIAVASYTGRRGMPRLYSKSEHPPLS